MSKRAGGGVDVSSSMEGGAWLYFYLSKDFFVATFVTDFKVLYYMI